MCGVLREGQGRAEQWGESWESLEGWDGEETAQEPGLGLGRPVPVRFGCSGAPSCVCCSRRKKLLASISSLHPKSAEVQAEEFAGSALCSLPSLLLSSFTSQPILFPLLLLVPDKQISPLPLCKNLFFLCCLIFPFSRTSLISLPALITEMSSFPQPAAARLGQG